MRHTLFRIVLAVLVAGLTVASLNASAQENPAMGSTAPVNGLEMYHEIHGEGQPLVLLHGGLGGTVEFAQILPLLAETRQVIAVELQGHGRTADIDRPLTYEAMADDVAALIEHLGYENADVMGYSMGGAVALQTAVRHPEVVDRLVLVSTAYARGGIHPEFLEGMSVMTAETANMMLETPMYQFYAGVAPQPEDWPALIGKIGDLMRQDYDWSEEVAAITAPTLIVAGDSDFITPTHAVELFTLMGGGVAGGFAEMPGVQFVMLPGTTHFDILYRTDLLPPLVTSFLDVPVAESG